MRQVDAQPVYFTASKGVHIIFRNEGALALLDPGKLDLFVPVEMGIKVRQYVLLNDDGLVARNGDGELQYFHLPEITPFADIISGLLISNKNRLKYGWP